MSAVTLAQTNQAMLVQYVTTIHADRADHPARVPLVSARHANKATVVNDVVDVDQHHPFNPVRVNAILVAVDNDRDRWESVPR